jgi:hypothetical protein
LADAIVATARRGSSRRCSEKVMTTTTKGFGREGRGRGKRGDEEETSDVEVGEKVSRGEGEGRRGS